MAWYDSVGSVIFGSSMDPNRGKYADGKYITDTVKGGIADAQNRQAPQAGQTQVGPAAQLDNQRQDQFRSQEMALAQQLGAVASGQQRGAGELAAQRAARDAMGNALGASTMGRGAGAVGAGRAAARSAGQIGLGAAGQSAQAAMGDQNNARAQLAQVLGQGRSADIGVAGQNAGAQNQAQLQQAQMNQQTALENVRARLQTMGYNDQAIQNYLQQLGNKNQTETQNRTADNGLAPGMLGAGAAVAAALSDANHKHDVEDASADVDAMLAALSPISWTYDDAAPAHLIPETMSSRGAGVMAQDLAATKLGALVVGEESGALVVDQRAAVSVLLAAAARLAERTRQLEARLDEVERAFRPRPADVAAYAACMDRLIDEVNDSHPHHGEKAQ